MQAKLDRIPSEPLSLDAYAGIAPASQLERARRLAGGLRGLRVLYAAAAPGEPSDASRTLVPLLRGLGVHAERSVLHGDRAFSAAARELTGALRGVRPAPPQGVWHAFREACEGAAVAAEIRSWDAVVVQGAAAAALAEGRLGGEASWIWRSGDGISSGGSEAQELLEPVLELYSQREEVALPGVDPLAARNRDPAPAAVGTPLRALGVDLSRPLVCQATRLDPWSDPVAAVESWRIARRAQPGLQLVLAGKIDPSDPEGAGVLAEIEAFAGGEPGLHVLTDRTGAGEEELNAACRVARCLIHTSLSGELDPATAESLWRGTPAIGAGEGDAAQIHDSVDGYLADSNEERAELIAELVADPARAVAMGRAGRERARGELLISRLLGDELELLADLTPGRGTPEAAKARA